MSTQVKGWAKHVRGTNHMFRIYVTGVTAQPENPVQWRYPVACIAKLTETWMNERGIQVTITCFESEVTVDSYDRLMHVLQCPQQYFDW